MIRGTAALVLVVGIASAQQPTLHDAWLRELLDADTKGAVAAYRAIADATARPEAERQAATARLAELQHCGAQVDAVPELLTRLPEALQQALAAAPRTPGLDAWVESARDGTDKLVERVRAAERGQPRPVSRPLLEPALRWIEQQSGPGSREQRRRLLEQLQQEARNSMAHSDAMLARFAAAIEAFGSTQGWWNRLLGGGESTGLNLKKEGIFPVVHGVRSLALQAQLAETNTAQRLEVLASRGVISARQASDWTQCLHYLMGLKLQAGLAEIDRDQPVSGDVDVTRLSTLERDLLKDALAVVKQCKTFLRQHFRLDVL